MKAPICEKCLGSEKLCTDCKKKLEEGKINDTDIKVSRFLYDLSKKHRSLRDVIVKKTFSSDEEIVITVRKGDASKVIGRGGDVAKKISEKLNVRNVKVAEEEKDFKKLTQSLISPAKLRGINILYPKKGEEIYKIRIAKADKEKVHDFWLKVIEKISDKDVEFAFE